MKAMLVICLGLISCQNSEHHGAATTTDSSLQLSEDSNTSNASQTSFDFVDSNRLILAGERIGKVKLGEDASKLQVLGTPDRSDAAMGKAWLTWMKISEEHNDTSYLNVYTTYRDNSMRQKTVQQIHTTSPYFSTEQGIHIRSSFEEIQKTFPRLEKSASYFVRGNQTILYDAIEKGIAFETTVTGKQRICSGIIVHEKNQKVTQIYIMLHPEMKRY